MRDFRNHRYEGEHFAAEKVMAALYLIMFVLIVGAGAHTQLLRTTPGAASAAAIQTAPR